MTTKLITLRIEKELLKVIDQTVELWNKLHVGKSKVTRSELLCKGGVIAVLRLKKELEKEMVKGNADTT